jgi:hypothetical protein
MLSPGSLRLCLPLAGANYNNGGSAGVFARNLNNARTNVSGNISARPDYGFSLKSWKGTVEP